MENYLKISEFSALSGISRKLLIFYDHYGLLHPAYIDPSNGYRYYSYRQLEIACIISQLRETEVPLERIRTYFSERSPERMIEILGSQTDLLGIMIEKLEKQRAMLQIRKARLEQGMQTGAGRLTVQRCPEQNLFLGEELPEESNTPDKWHYLPEFYQYSKAKGIEWGLPIGNLIDYEKLIHKKWHNTSRYFFHLPDGIYPAFFTRPAGLYVIGVAYGNEDPLFQQIFSYIEQNNYEICGNAYYEYLLSVAEQEESIQHLTQISVQVRKTPGA